MLGILPVRDSEKLNNVDKTERTLLKELWGIPLRVFPFIASKQSFRDEEGEGWVLQWRLTKSDAR